MTNYKNILVSSHNGVFELTLNREHKRNAIDEQTMDELVNVLQNQENFANVHLAVLRAKGKDFCAGADLDWMRSTGNLGEEDLVAQNLKLQRCFQLWFDLPVFTIAHVHGNVIGGGLGLMACSDLVISGPSASFRFSEVTLGLVPAIIAPFVLQRTQNRLVRNAMITAMPMDANQALKEGLIDIIADSSKADELVSEYAKATSAGEKNAVAQCKKLINDLQHNRINEPLDIYTTRLLARMRKSESASGRMENFFKSLDRKHENK
jgi:methylglutaconyl-CoA hydratase